MSREAALRSHSRSPAISLSERYEFGRQVLRREADAIAQLASRLDDSFNETLELMFACEGSVIVSGVGKAGLIGRKIAATLASTGSPSHFLHPAEAFHGDLGRIAPTDVVLLLSHSGESSEVVQLLPALMRFGNAIVAMTSAPHSRLAQAAQVRLLLGPIEEACSLRLAPSTSTAAMLALGDALALTLSRMRNFQSEDFARFHPGGSLGLKLRRVEEQMRPLAECRVAHEHQSVREVIVACTKPGRRSGAILLLDEQQQLRGLFTDSDLARLVEQRQETALDKPICEVMTSQPTTILVGATLNDALEILAAKKISELPVTDEQGHPVGVIDVTDIVGLSANLVESPRETSPATMRIFPSHGD